MVMVVLPAIRMDTGWKSNAGCSAMNDLQGIELFADMLWLERGLSKNTLDSYQSDLRQAAKWLEVEKHTGLIVAHREHLLAYLADLALCGHSARTSARRLSALRQFFQYALREGWIKEDPTLEIQAPRLGRPLPKTLT
ncbi:MAG TPA: hypothetical protein ENG92_00415, partial [Thiolapillus brandeum]|nr:hypothetical protein [Thiolapillus brandeum]